MKLVSLTLEYFRQYRSATVAFSDGLTGIIGPNGSGKTTLLEGIAFALFGSKGLRGKVDEVLQRGAPRGSDPYACLVFEHEGQVFRAERRGSEASLFQGGEAMPLASGSRDVTNFISGVIRMTYEEFFATYFTEQKGLEFLSGQKGAAERERFIVRLLGYDRFEKVQELLRAERRDVKTDLVGRESALGERATLEERLKTEVAECTTLETALREAAESLAQLETKATQAKKRFIEVESRKNLFQKGVVELKELEARISERKRVEESLRSQVQELELRESQQRRLLTLNATSDWTELDAKIQSESSARTDKRNAYAKELQESEHAWRQAQAEADTQARVIEAQHAERLKRLERMRGLSDQAQCPTCGQTLSSSFEQVLKGHAEELVGQEQERQMLRARAVALKETPPEIVSLRAKLQELDTELAQIKERAGFILTLSQIIRERSVMVERLHASETETKALAERVQVLSDAALKSNFSEEMYLREKAAFEMTQSLESSARLRRVKIEGELSAKQAMAERTKAELVTFDGKRRALEERRELLVTLEESDTFLTDFRSYVNGSIRPRLAELASEFITELTDGRYTAVEVGRDFSPTVLEDGEQKAVISGGEEDILNLCMRFALSQMLAERAGHSFSLMVLDEVFGSLDEQRRMNVLQLMEKLSERFEQILIVTHLDDVKEGVRHLYHVEYDEATGCASVQGQGDLGEFEFAEAV